MLKLFVIISAAIALVVGTCSKSNNGKEYKQIQEMPPLEKGKHCESVDINNKGLQKLVKLASPLIPQVYTSDYVLTYGGIDTPQVCSYEWKGLSVGYKLSIILYQSNCLRNDDSDCDPYDESVESETSFVCDVILFPYDYYFEPQNCILRTPLKSA